jgi:putative FmdB family regulatory protein
MAVFEYRCEDCGSRYDVLHLGREKTEDVFCPECRSTNHKKMLSVFNSSSNSGTSRDSAPMPSCASGACGIGGGCFN